MSRQDAIELAAERALTSILTRTLIQLTAQIAHQTDDEAIIEDVISMFEETAADTTEPTGTPARPPLEAQAIMERCHDRVRAQALIIDMAVRNYLAGQVPDE